jgi:tetratricopeptide (TPR) repeat protein
MICPFLSSERVVREVKYDASGKVIEQKETPGREMIECLKKDCYMFDQDMSTCSLLALPASSESLKTLIRFTRELKDALASVQETTNTGVAEQGKLVDSMRGVQKEANEATQLAVNKVEEELKALARITSDVRRGVEGLLERSQEYASRIEETTKELMANLTLALNSQGTMVKDAATESARILEERLEAYSEKLKGVASDSAQTIHEGFEKQTSRLTEASGQLSRELQEKVESEGNALKETIAQASQRVEAGSETQTEKVVNALTASSETMIEKLSWKLDETSDRQAGVAKETAGRLSEGLEKHGDRMTEALDSSARKLVEALQGQTDRAVESTREAREALLQAFERLAQRLDALGAGWSDSLAEGVVRLLSGIQDSTKAVESAAGANERLLSSISSNVVDAGEKSFGALKEMTGKVEEMRGEVNANAAAQLEEQRRAGTSFESFSGALGNLSKQVESVTEKIAQANKEMMEFVQAVRDEREEEKRRATLEAARDHNDRGVALYFRKSYAGALKEFEKAIELDPTMAEAHSNTALCLTSLGKEDEAAASFKRALEIAPEMAEAYNNLGLYHFKKKDYEQALAMFQEAVKKREDYPNAYYNLGSAYKELGMHDKALAAWEQVLRLDPANARAKEAIDETRGA